MAQVPTNSSEMKMLPGGGGEIVANAQSDKASNTAPSRQLAEIPKDELEHLAEEYGLDPHDYKSRQHLVAAIHDRRQVIATMDREAMLDVVRWGRRPVTANATKEQIAMEIARITSMRFGGLSQRGLVVLGWMRGLRVEANEEVPVLVRKLKKQEGLFRRLNRKRRAWLGSMVANMIGEEDNSDYQFVPPAASDAPSSGTTSAASRSATIKEDIEEAGLLGGIASRVKKSADSYLNQKLDEIEARIDRKLDEIDRRLAEWRDKEIANRIRILKITLWVSVIVGAFSLIYSYVQLYFPKGGKRDEYDACGEAVRGRRESASEGGSIRGEYQRHGAEAFYRERGSDYRNPHEEQIGVVLRDAVRRWKLDLSDVLDLAAGSGEATLVLRELGARHISGVDPFTAAAYETRTGLGCEQISFEEIAAGAISSRRFSLIVCSFAMHLCAGSRLAGLAMQLSQVAPGMIVVTPHKRPVLKAEWGWKLEDEFVLQRVRTRWYRSSFVWRV